MGRMKIELCDLGPRDGEHVEVDTAEIDGKGVVFLPLSDRELDLVHSSTGTRAWKKMGRTSISSNLELFRPLV